MGRAEIREGKNSYRVERAPAISGTAFYLWTGFLIPGAFMLVSTIINQILQSWVFMILFGLLFGFIQACISWALAAAAKKQANVKFRLILMAITTVIYAAGLATMTAIFITGHQLHPIFFTITDGTPVANMDLVMRYAIGYGIVYAIAVALALASSKGKKEDD